MHRTFGQRWPPESGDQVQQTHLSDADIPRGEPGYFLTPVALPNRARSRTPPAATIDGVRPAAYGSDGGDWKAGGKREDAGARHSGPSEDQGICRFRRPKVDGSRDSEARRLPFLPAPKKCLCPSTRRGVGALWLTADLVVWLSVGLRDPGRGVFT